MLSKKFVIPVYATLLALTSHIAPIAARGATAASWS